MLKKNNVPYELASPEFIATIKKRIGFLEKSWIANANNKGIDGAAAMAYYKQTAAEVTKQTRGIFAKK